VQVQGVTLVTSEAVTSVLAYIWPSTLQRHRHSHRGSIYLSLVVSIDWQRSTCCNRIYQLLLDIFQPCIWCILMTQYLQRSFLSRNLCKLPSPDMAHTYRKDILYTWQTELWNILPLDISCILLILGVQSRTHLDMVRKVLRL
jgi:hypothetical protein